jgi:hypothetical protein
MYRVLAFLLIVFLSACSGLPRSPEVTYQLGQLLDTNSFDDNIGWDNQQQGAVSVGVDNGVYRIQTNVASYVRGYGIQAYDNVVIEVDAVQLSAHRNNAFGVACRGSFDSDSANGYYFLIGGDGTYSIRRGRQGDLEPIIKWAQTDAVREGAGRNVIRVVCIDDYLALYINDVFVADARDSTYSEGRVGFAAATEAGIRLDVTFDNLQIYAGRLSN